MKLQSRHYSTGDERNINKLYYQIKGVKRTSEEYEWEWLKTWDGHGDIWLLFDLDREDGDQLVGQYSLIPTPISFWGNIYSGGKTENCMSHSDYRGKGIYFPHEKKYFSEAKKRFQVFFTTAGDVARGAPGAIRRKLGYTALDSWVRYLFLIDSSGLEKMIQERLEDKIGTKMGLSKLLSRFMSKVLYFMRFRCQNRQVEFESVQILDEKEANLDEIATLWKNNCELYGISVNRTKEYLHWRINQNPYSKHSYLVCYKNNALCGYIVFNINDKNIVNIIDIIAENVDFTVFKAMLESLIAYSKQNGYSMVFCGTLSGNRILEKVFKQNRFFRIGNLAGKRMTSSSVEKKPFHVFISETVDSSEDFLNPENWYVTRLFCEGRG